MVIFLVFITFVLFISIELILSYMKKRKMAEVGSGVESMEKDF